MVHHAVHGAQDDGESLVHKYKHHRDLGQVIRVGHLLAPGEKKDTIKTQAATGRQNGLKSILCSLLSICVGRTLSFLTPRKDAVKA